MTEYVLNPSVPWDGPCPYTRLGFLKTLQRLHDDNSPLAEVYVKHAMKTGVLVRRGEERDPNRDLLDEWRSRL